MIEADEKVLDSVMLQQWLPGYEPDLTRPNQPVKRGSKGKHKQQARNKALGHKSPKKPRRG
jgi:hypothetical protein